MPEPPKIRYADTSQHVQRWEAQNGLNRLDGPAILFRPSNEDAMSMGWFAKGLCVSEVFVSRADGPLYYEEHEL